MFRDRDQIVRWTFRIRHRCRHTVPGIVREHPNLRTVRLRTHHEVESWISSLAPSRAEPATRRHPVGHSGVSVTGALKATASGTAERKFLNFQRGCGCHAVGTRHIDERLSTLQADGASMAPPNRRFRDA